MQHHDEASFVFVLFCTALNVSTVCPPTFRYTATGDNKYPSNYRFLIAAGTQVRYLVKSCDWLLQKDRHACKTRKVLGCPYALTPHRSPMSQCATLSHLWNSETSSIHRGPTASRAQTLLLSPSRLEFERPVESSIWPFGATGTVTCCVPDEFPTATGCNLQPPVEIKGPISTLSSKLVAHPVGLAALYPWWSSNGRPVAATSEHRNGTNSTSLSIFRDTVTNSLHGRNSLPTQSPTRGLGTRTGTTWEGIDSLR